MEKWKIVYPHQDKWNSERTQGGGASSLQRVSPVFPSLAFLESDRTWCVSDSSF